MNKTNTKYLENFFNEKEIPFESWEIKKDGTTHFIDNEVVIESIKKTIGKEQQTVCDTLRKIDFHNGDVNHYLNHLAKGLVNNY